MDIQRFTERADTFVRAAARLAEACEQPFTCLVPKLSGVSCYQLKEEGRWDKYYTEQPRPRTLSEQKYKRLKRASAR